MDSSKRAGRPPRYPRSDSMRNVKALAHQRSAQGICVLFFGLLEFFVAVEADLCPLDLSGRQFHGVGAVSTRITGSNVVSGITLANPTSDSSPPGIPKVTDGFGGSSEHADLFGSRNAGSSTQNTDSCTLNRHANDKGCHNGDVNNSEVATAVVNEETS